MCGIIGMVGGRPPNAFEAVNSLGHRGPDAAFYYQPEPTVFLGHTRLAILDLDPRSNCPFHAGSISLSYNGELWNYRELRAELEGYGIAFTTTGDTEVVARALDYWGVWALPRMEGMFALAWYDRDARCTFLARDRFGEIPLHYYAASADLFAPPVAFYASELRGIAALGGNPSAAGWVLPGTYVRIPTDDPAPRVTCWYDAPVREKAGESLETAAAEIRRLLGKGVRERSISHVPVCALLSGGIDSSAVLMHLKEAIPDVVAYTAVYDPASLDLKLARIVANTLDVPLIEVPVTSPNMTQLRETVRRIEMPFKAQVEIGWPCLRLAERMRAEGHKVVFSGEGSDELWASYGFSYYAEQEDDFDWCAYRKQLFVGQHRKNFARVNKVFMAHGVEGRLPFLHTELVEYALSLPEGAVRDDGSLKALLRDGYAGLLPPRVLTRPKVAFQDGLGLKKSIAERVMDPRKLYKRMHEEVVGT